MIDNETPNFGLPLPDGSNLLSDDVGRLIAALGLIDSTMALFAPANSPALTGVPTAPTAGTGANTNQIATTAFVHAAVAALVNSSPATLDTLKELATALGNDANFATTITTALAGKLGLAGGTMTGVITFAAAQRVAASIVTGLAAVATSGSYGDLSGKPTLPSSGAPLGLDSGGTGASYADADAFLRGLGFDSGAGWRKLPDGQGGIIIEQWGTVNVSDDQYALVTFPIAFNSVPENYHATPIYNAAYTGGDALSCHVGSVSVGSMRVGKSDTGNVGSFLATWSARGR